MRVHHLVVARAGLMEVLVVILKVVVARLDTLVTEALVVVVQGALEMAVAVVAADFLVLGAAVVV